VEIAIDTVAEAMQAFLSQARRRDLAHFWFDMSTFHTEIGTQSSVFSVRGDLAVDSG
jgi:hypothetical protein